MLPRQLVQEQVVEKVIMLLTSRTRVQHLCQQLQKLLLTTQRREIEPQLRLFDVGELVVYIIVTLSFV
jgi:hypothetical protein